MAYTIREITGTKPWDGKYGPMVDYYLTVTDSQGVDTPRVTLPQKASSPAPTIGQVLDGNIDNTPNGLKFKKAFSPGGGGGGGGGRPKDPQERAAIAASVALREGREALQQAVALNLVDPSRIEGIEDHAHLWKRYAEFAFKFIESKSKAA